MSFTSFFLLGFNEEFEPLFSEKKSEQTEKEKSEQTEEKESELDVVNNLGNKNYQTTVNNQKYDFNKAKNFY